MTDSLFPDIAEPEPAGPPPGLGADAQRTWRRQREIEAGIHPATKLALADNGRTCGDCVHMVLKNGPALGVGAGRWWKCTETLRDGRGPDMRKHWPACVSFQGGEP